MSFPCLLALVSVLPVVSSAQGAPAGGAHAQEGVTRVVLHTSPVVDLYFSVRAAAARPSVSELFAPAVAAVRTIDRALGGSPLAWEPLDGRLSGCTTAADVKAAFGGIADSLGLDHGSTPGGKEVELRAPALALADALVALEPAFLETWKEHEAELAEARARWETKVGPKERALLDFHRTSLGMPDPKAELSVYLVTDAPWPGAETMLDTQGRGVSFVGVSFIAAGSAPDSQFFEIVLHEVTHTLDVASGEASVFGELRARLGAAGLDPRDRRLHDLPHTLMFVQAAESIRRVIDPAHVDYGEIQKVYARSGPGSEDLRGFWRDHLDGKLTRAEALDLIVASLQPAAR